MRRLTLYFPFSTFRGVSYVLYSFRERNHQ